MVWLLALAGTVLVASFAPATRGPGRAPDAWIDGGPDGGLINCLDRGPDGTIWAGSPRSGIFYQVPGQRWAATGTSLERRKVRVIRELGGDTLFVGTEQGLFVSHNHGQDFAANGSIPGDAVVNDIFFLDAIRRSILLGTENRGVYRSDDYGNNWHQLTTFFDTLRVRAFARDVNRFYIGTFGAGILVSLDGGITWLPTAPLPDPKVTKLLTVPTGGATLLYAGTAERGVAFSENGGLSWIQTNLDGMSVTDLQARGTAVYATTEAMGVFRSTAGQLDWTPMSTGLPYYFTTALLAPSGTTQLWTATSGGIFRTTTEADPWQDANDSLRANVITGIALDSTRPMSVFISAWGGGVFRSDDRGATWQRLAVPSIPFISALAATAGDTGALYAGTAGGVFSSQNSGRTWSWRTHDSSLVRCLAVDPTDPSRIYLGSSTGLWRSTNRGAAWNLVWGQAAVNRVVIDPTESMNIFLATSTGVFRSANGGASFTQSLLGLPPFAAADITISPAAPGTLYAGFGDAATGVYRTTDRAATWERLPLDGNVQSVAVDARDPLIVAAGTTRDGLHLSFDAGASWTEFGPAYPRTINAVSLNVAATHSLSFAANDGCHAYIDETGPALTLAVEPDTVSPDGDGVQDTLVVSATGSDSVGIASWRLVIGRGPIEVARWLGDSLPVSVRWDGFDATGRLAPTGIYQVTLSVTDRFANRTLTDTGMLLQLRPLVSGDPEATAPSAARKLAHDVRGRRHVVYTTGAVPEVFYSASSDGRTWDPPVDLSDSRDVPSRFPALALRADSLPAVAWQEGDGAAATIRYRQLVGGLWSPAEVVSDSDAAMPNLSASHDTVHVVWSQRQGGGIEIFYRMRRDAWQTTERVTQNPGDSRSPIVLPAAGQVHFFWSDNTPGNYEIFWKVRDSASIVNISQNDGPSVEPHAALTPDQGWVVVWTDSTSGPGEILSRRFRPGIGLDVSATDISRTTDRAGAPSVTSDSSRLYVVWQQGLGPSAIYGAICDLTGLWLEPTNVSRSAATCRNPSLATPARDGSAEALWTAGYMSPYQVAVATFGVVTDTTTPRLTGTIPDTVRLDEEFPCALTASEPLASVTGWVRDADQESTALLFASSPDSIHFVCETFVGGLHEGTGLVRIEARDPEGNLGTVEQPVTIVRARGQVLPAGQLYLYPNPVRSREATVTVRFVATEPVLARFEIFTLTGRRLTTTGVVPFTQPGVHTRELDVSGLGTDVYLVKVYCLSTTSARTAVAVRKLGVIR